MKMAPVSRPVRGAWIEINHTPEKSNATDKSRPVRGAWIEIGMQRKSTAVLVSRPVRGAWIEIKMSVDNDFDEVVAPRKGRVD